MILDFIFGEKTSEKLCRANESLDALLERFDDLMNEYARLQKYADMLENDLIEANERVARLERRMHDVDGWRINTLQENIRLKEKNEKLHERLKAYEVDASK